MDELDEKIKSAVEDVCITYGLVESKGRGDGSGIFDIEVQKGAFEFGHQCALAAQRVINEEKSADKSNSSSRREK